MAYETAHEAYDVALNMFHVNSDHASVLFDYGASHSFINVAYMCLKANLKVLRTGFWARLMAPNSSGIDVILRVG